jgi:hypothetical protein
MSIYTALVSRLFIIVGSFVLLLAVRPALAEVPPESLPNILSQEAIAQETFLPDFSFAGFKNGIGEIPDASGSVFSVDEFGAIPDDGKDDSKAVMAALTAAQDVAGSVIIRFSAGRYRISEVLKVERSDIVIQGNGSGAGGTTLYFPRPLQQVDKSSSLDELRKYLIQLNKRQVEPENNLDEYFSEYSWSGGFLWIQRPGTRPAAYLEEYDPEIEKLTDVSGGERGSRRLVVIDSSDLRAGDLVQVQWLNSSGPQANIIKSLYGSDHALAGSHHWSFPKRPLVAQTLRIERVDGNSVTLSGPLLHDANDAIPAHLAKWEGLQHVGVEELHLEFPPAVWFGHHMERGYNGIYFTSAFDSWARNLRITNADSGILSYNSANLTYRDITTDGNRKAHYGVHMGNVHNVLAENVTVLNPVLHSLTFNTQSTKCVYKSAVVHVAPILDQHAGANHQNLFDNVTLHSQAKRSDEGPVAVVFDGSGAGYWQPGHGGFNTTWNLRVLINGGAFADEIVTIQGIDEGPMARIVGLHGNRKFKLEYHPTPYVEMLNVELKSVPSLYDYQLAQRQQAGD